MKALKKAVVLFSGGLDSATAAAVARKEGHALFALSIDYGQRHRIELEAAKRVGASLGVREHKFLSVDLSVFGKSALTDDIAVPKADAPEAIGNAIPVTYVPARNTIFLSLALAYAETLDCFVIYAGMNAVDYSGYPDCRPEFLKAFERTANLGTQKAVEGRGTFSLQTPLLELNKAEIIRLGGDLGVDFALTHSCYDPDVAGRACGRCDSCVLRKRGFSEAGVFDPTRYRT